MSTIAFYGPARVGKRVLKAALNDLNIVGDDHNAVFLADDNWGEGMDFALDLAKDREWKVLAIGNEADVDEEGIVGDLKNEGVKVKVSKAAEVLFIDTIVKDGGMLFVFKGDPDADEEIEDITPLIVHALDTKKIEVWDVSEGLRQLVNEDSGEAPESEDSVEDEPTPKKAKKGKKAKKAPVEDSPEPVEAAKLLVESSESEESEESSDDLPEAEPSKEFMQAIAATDSVEALTEIMLDKDHKEDVKLLGARLGVEIKSGGWQSKFAPQVADAYIHEFAFNPTATPEEAPVSHDHDHDDADAPKQRVAKVIEVKDEQGVVVSREEVLETVKEPCGCGGGGGKSIHVMFDIAKILKQAGGNVEDALTYLKGAKEICATDED